jgi:hypothetical protein
MAKEIGPLTAAIREALVALRDPEASVGDVRAKIIELHPDLKEEAEKLAANKVYQSREWARQQIAHQPTEVATRGLGRKSRIDHPHPVLSPMERYEIAERFHELCGGDVQRATEMLSLMSKTDAEELQKSYEGWLQLVATAGSSDKARQMVQVMQTTGMI